MVILFIIIHLIGAIVSYVSAKNHILKESNKFWTVGDRIHCIGFSIIGGWVSVFVTYFLNWVDKKDKIKANW